MHIHQWFVNLVADLSELSELSRVARDFALKFRPHWPGWMSCWVPPICPKVGYNWFPYHPQPLWVLLVTAWNAVSKKLATRGNFLQVGVTSGCTSLHKVVKLCATLCTFYNKILMYSRTFGSVDQWWWWRTMNQHNEVLGWGDGGSQNPILWVPWYAVCVIRCHRM